MRENEWRTTERTISEYSGRRNANAGEKANGEAQGMDNMP